MNKRILSALGLVALLASAPACATYAEGGYGGYRDRGYAREIERRAYDRGYREGLEEGRSDGRRGRDYAPSRHDEYRDADDGYHRGDGDRDFYRRNFRRGFEVGYRDAYDQFRRGRDWRR